MVPPILSGKRLTILLAASNLAVCAAFAQTPAPSHCAVSAAPTQVRAEGVAEIMGDLIFQCSGSNPGVALSGNLTVFFPVSVTNRVDSNNNAVDATLSVDYGSGYTPTGILGRISNQSITFGGLSIAIPASGQFGLKVSNIRANVRQAGIIAPQSIQASISAPFAMDQSVIPVAYPQPGLFATLYSTGIACTGSALPPDVTLANLFAAQTAFASTRLTEGFAGAFAARGPNDTNGTRFLVQYSGFPAGAQVYVPDFVAGSDALVPTNGGDLGGSQTVGQYVPGSGTLLLARVNLTDSSGAGGYVVQLPGGSMILNSVSPVGLTNGSGFVVYEVVDSNPGVMESAQFPTFFGIAGNTATALAQESVSFAPVSTVNAASVTAPVPRFAATTPASDCGIVGDCQAGYFPKLSVPTSSVSLSANFGGRSEPEYVRVNNTAGGVMNWSATAAYSNGLGWLYIAPSSGTNNATIQVSANAAGLAAGIYKANLLIDAGPLAGNATVPITLAVQTSSGAPGATGSTGATGAAGSTGSTGAMAPTVTVNSVVSAASFAPAPIVPGSLTTILGSNLAGKNVSVTFDGSPAQLLYTSAGQINLLVPPLAAESSTTMLINVDGAASTPEVLPVSPAWPAVFNNGVLNQNNGVNGPSSPARSGEVVQIFLTGIPDGAAVSVLTGKGDPLQVPYAGPAPGIPGVQQVNVKLPGEAGGGSAPITICAAAGGQYCSTAFPVNMQ
jgi:uncharacterized protein (TIGR03437 family)